MIESLYWKEKLAQIAKSIRPITMPKRWSERAVCSVERDVMIGFFIVRRLMELHKVSSGITEMRLDVFSAPTTKNVTKLDQVAIDENYDWNAERVEKKQVLYICHQCVHARLSFVERSPDRNWSNLLVVSDYDLKERIWRIPFPEIIRLFVAASNDWPNHCSITYNDNKRDYTIVTD